MRLRIHHGAAEIGGNCIELESQGRAILLDLGLPLDSAPVVPDVEGLRSANERLLGVILSHPHLDHYGLLGAVRSDLPVWLGEGAQRLLEAAKPFTSGASLAQKVTSYRDRQAFEVGPFRITPYLMDHSAYDAHALLVEADGKRVFYSGDFRGHGRKAGVFERFVANPPGDIDVLLMEGTTIGRDGEGQSEAQVEHQALELMQAHKGLILACFAGQNIDRFVTFLRASVRAGRTFVIDVYMASLLNALQMSGLPDVRRHPKIRIFLPKAQKRMILREKRFDLVEPFRGRRIFHEELSSHPGRFCMMFRTSMIGDMEDADLTGGALLYSLWPGYLQRDSTDLRRWADMRGLSFQLVHSSGHAHRKDLQRMASAVRPNRLIPIHSDKPEAYESLSSASIAHPTERGSRYEPRPRSCGGALVRRAA